MFSLIFDELMFISGKTKFISSVTQKLENSLIYGLHLTHCNWVLICDAGSVFAGDQINPFQLELI